MTYKPLSEGQGDWRSYPHLGSRKVFKDMMTPRAEVFMNHVWKVSRHEASCQICAASRGYNEHLGGPAHFKMLCDTYVPNGAVVAEVRVRLWNKLAIPGGWIRMNELDGAIEVARGADPDLQPQAPPCAAAPQPARHQDPPASYKSWPQPEAPWQAPHASGAQAPAEDDDAFSVHACRAPPNYEVVAETSWKVFWKGSMWRDAKAVEEKLCAAFGARHIQQCDICKEETPSYSFAAHLLSQEHFCQLMEATHGASGLGALFAGLVWWAEGSWPCYQEPTSSGRPSSSCFDPQQARLGCRALPMSSGPKVGL